MENHFKFKVIDNFLDKKEFVELQSIMMGNQFPWYYNSHKISAQENNSSLYNFQFAHKFYDNYGPTSDLISILEPLINKINPSSIVRIKANMNPSTPDILEYGYHTDFDSTPSLITSVFYINTNNGSTVFEDGQKVDSVENRLVMFDSRIKHTGTSCTNEKVRCVINLNYYLWKNEI
jgi:hypothetical protein